MKKIIPKIILVLSFAPYVLTLLYGIYSMANGFTFFWSTTYGFEAFRDSTLLMMLMLCYFPIIPPCIIYQLVYLSVFIMKKLDFSEDKIILFSCTFAGTLIIIAGLIYFNI